MDDLWQRLLLWAADNGQLRIVELLIEIGADPDVKDEFGYTSLHLSVAGSHLLIVKTLLDANASVTAKSKTDETALLWAAELGDENVIRSLLEAGAATNTRNGYLKKISLYKAVGHNHCRAIELLLAGRSDPNAQNRYGETALWTKVPISLYSSPDDRYKCACTW